jgi:CO/xanthine dehydrogenase Mo-binding subunit
VTEAAATTSVTGRDKVLGLARYAADRRLPGMLWAAYVRSPLAHARISRVDSRAALAVAGVRAVLTGADVRPAAIGRNLQDWPVLAWDRVRFIGDRVAVVAADSPDVAVRAAGLVAVDYEDLPAVFDPERALDDGAPVLHPDATSYRQIGAARPARRHPNIQGEHLIVTGDADIEQAMARADRVFEHEFRTPRQHQGYLEPHACVAWLEGDRIHVISTNKGPFKLRTQLATSLAVDPATIVVESPVIGGDFGGKGLSLDEYACACLARATGRPVMAVMDYGDELQSSAPRHATRLVLRTGVDREGLFLAHHVRAVVDGGAYAAGKPGAALAPIGALETLGPYRVPTTRLEIVAVYTNNLPGGNMRAPGEYQAIFAGESHLDLIATELGMDPLDLRRRNALRNGDTTVTGGVARRPRVLEVVEALDEIAERRPRRSGSGHGIGFAIGIRGPASGRSTVSLRLREDGRIEALSGIPDQGGGTNAVIAGVVSRILDVDPARIDVRSGSTELELDDSGVSGSRVAYHASRAAELAATALRDRLEAAAATVIGVGPGRVSLRGDAFVLGSTAGEPGHRRPFDAVARDLTVEPVTITFDGRDDTRESSYDSVAGYAVEVDVDPETGEIRIADATLVADVGGILNPVGHEGQLRGGFAGGVGGALFEELPVESGRVAAANLSEYKLPSTLDVPPLEIVYLPEAVGPGAFGAKMAGEMTNSAVAPAIANAIADAVGVRLHELPLSAERLYRRLHPPTEAAPRA